MSEPGEEGADHAIAEPVIADRVAEEPVVAECAAEAAEASAHTPEAAPHEDEAATAEAPLVEEAPVEAAPVEEPAPPPRITRVEPMHAPLAGATIAIEGEGFAEGCSVTFDGAPAETTFESATRLSVVAPARDAKGDAEIRVTNHDGQSDAYADRFHYEPAPIIAGTEPSCVSTEGGTVLTILGADFAEGCTVRVAGALVPSSRAHGGRLEVLIAAALQAPAGRAAPATLAKREAGEIDLVVENPDGQRAVRERAVRFAAPPAVVALVPASDVTAGGAEIRIEGRGFEKGAAVLVAGEPVASVTFASESELRFVAPPRASVEAVDVAVVNPSGLAHRLPRAFAYVKAPPRIASVAPDRGPNGGGTVLVVRGSGFDEGTAAYVCGIAAAVAFKTADEIAITTPAVARDGLVDVRVVNRDEQAHTLDKAFLYVAAMPPPLLREVSPKSGPQAGGLKVALLGDDFAEGVIVRFGGVAAAVQFLTRKELAVTTPAFAGSGEVAVEVENPDGATSQLEAAFVYEARPAPEITGISVTSGPTTGGTKVVIEGKNFTRDAAVYIGREHPKDMAIKSATEIVIVTAARKQAGVVDVEVATPGAVKAIMKNGFRYDAVPAPVITSIAPNAGGIGGGTEITISGKNFLKESVVLVDGKAPKTVKFLDATTLELKTPPGDAGKMADVIVRNPDGKEAVQKRAFLYDPRYRG